MADITERPPIQTPPADRRDIGQLTGITPKLLRALENLFRDMNTVVPNAIQEIGQAAQQALDDSSQASSAAASAQTALLMLDELRGLFEQSSDPRFKFLSVRIDELERALADLHTPVLSPIEKFIAPTLLNSWVDFGAGRNPTGFYKDAAGVVRLRGVIKSGTIGTVVFTLPFGYRPLNQELLVSVSNAAIGYLDIGTNGDVSVNTGSNVWFSLDGMTFRAA